MRRTATGAHLFAITTAAQVTANDPPNVPLHDTIAAAFVRTREALRPREHAAQDRRIKGYLEEVESDLRDVIGPFVAEYVADDTTDPKVRDALSVLAAPEHFSQASILFAAVGALFYPLISAIMSAPAASLAQASFHNNPSVQLSPAEVALAVLRDNLGAIDPYLEASYSGVDRPRLDVLIKNTGEPPGLAQLLEAFRRGIIDRARLEHGIRQSRVRNEWIDVVEALRYAPPSIGEIMAGRVQNHLPDAKARELAEDTGLAPEHFDWLHETHGRPPGTQELIQLLNRGLVTEDFVRAAIRESDIKNKYIDPILQTRVYLPPVRSIPAMLRHGTLTDARARELLASHGVRPEDIDVYVEEGHVQRSGTVRELTQAQVVRLYTARMITRATALVKLSALRFHDDDANLLLDFADDARREQLTNAAIRKIGTLYVGRKIERVDAINALSTAGVPTEAQHDLLAVWDIERDVNVHTPTIANVLHAYRQELVTPAYVHDALVRLGVDQADMRIVVAGGFPPTMHGDELHVLVDAVVNRAATIPGGPGGTSGTRRLREDEVLNLYQSRRITRDEALQYLLQLHYSAVDANRILDLNAPPPSTTGGTSP